MAYLMVVDDNEDLATAMAFALEEAGHTVVTKLDTADALTEMHRRPPDLAILDCMFPGNDFAGLELARAMSQAPDLKRITILMLTGVNQELGTKLSTYDIDNTWLPVSDFLEKPIDFAQLVGKVKALLQNAAARPK